MYQQSLRVDPSAPVAVIGNITEGTYAPPGASLEFIGAESYDYDDDIIRYEWRIDAPMGTVVSTQPNLTYQPLPGIHLIHLTVIDSLGSISTDMVNITAGSSSPMLGSLSYDPKIIRADETTDVIITVVHLMIQIEQQGRFRLGLLRMVLALQSNLMTMELE